ISRRRGIRGRRRASVQDRTARLGDFGGRSDRRGSARRSSERARRGADRNGARGASSHRRRALAPAPRRRRYGLALVKLVLGIVSTLVFGLTGYGWTTFQDLHQGLSTTNVIGGPPTPDKATDILLVGLDSRTDAHDRPLPRQVLAQLRAGDNEGELTDT